MAGLVLVLLLTLHFTILDCTERSLRLVHQPYGPTMCRQLCEDLDDNFYYLPEDLSCHRVPRKFPAVFTKDPIKYCHMEDVSQNHAADFPVKTRLHVCKRHYEDVHQPTLQNLTTKTTSDPCAGHGSQNSSLLQACQEGKLCAVQFRLSQRQADIDDRDKLGRTPVMIATIKNRITVFDFLVSRSCDLTVIDNNNDTVLHIACIVGNADIVRKLVFYQTCDIESRGRNGMTPVMCSALHGHRDVFKLLVCMGCNVSVVDNNMNNILHVACSGGHVDMVKYVIRHVNTDLESRGEKGRTPLMIAAHHGHKGVFDFLARKGSNLFAVDDNNDNSLHVACISGRLAMIQHILSKTSIGIESRGKNGRTSVMRAAEFGQRSVAEFLVKNSCNVTVVDDNNNNLLHVACEGGHLDMVEYILSKWKIPIDSRGENGHTPLMTAIKYGQTDVFKYLLSKGCNPLIKNTLGYNILHVACAFGHLIIVKNILSQTSISIESEGRYGRTPVMTAANFGQKSIYMFLVRQRCKLRLSDNKQNNILHVACIGGHIVIVKHIVEKVKIGMNIRGNYGRTPLLTATLFGHKSVVEYLKNKGCELYATDMNGNNILHLACMSGKLDVVEYAISLKKVYVNSRGQSGRTPVMTAASFGFMSLVKYLEKKGCNLSMTDNAGNSILHLACMSGNLLLVKYILSQTKIDINRKGELGRTAVMTAAYFGFMSLVKYFETKGCKLTIKDTDGNNLLHVACMSGNLELVKYLISKTKLGMESTDMLGWTPVMVASHRGHLRVVRYLRNIGCKLSVLSTDGYNIFHIACMSGNIDVAKYVFKHSKVKIDSTGEYGRTPAIIAAYFGRTGIVRYLVRKGCDLTKVDEHGSNVLDAACLGHRKEVVEYLITVKPWLRTC